MVIIENEKQKTCAKLPFGFAGNLDVAGVVRRGYVGHDQRSFFMGQVEGLVANSGGCCITGLIIRGRGGGTNGGGGDSGDITFFSSSRSQFFRNEDPHTSALLQLSQRRSRVRFQPHHNDDTGNKKATAEAQDRDPLTHKKS